jgi:hypothetical protein
VQTVAGQNGHYHEIRNQQREIERVGRVQAFESFIQKLCLQILDESPLSGEGEHKKKIGGYGDQA